MKYRILGKTGLKVSVIGFGGIPIQRVSIEDACSIVNRSLDLGINFFDTARGYTDSEEKLGRALRNRRGEAIIATKSMARSAREMLADIHRSLETMGVAHIDLYQMHNIKDQEAFQTTFGPGGALEALKEAKARGLIGHIGVTGHIKSILMEIISTGEVETVQFPFNPVENAGAAELLELAGRKGVGVIVMKPLAGGAFRNAGLALRYLLQHRIATVIPGMDSCRQVEENASLAEEGSLTPEESRLLEEEAAGLGTTFCRRCEYCQPCQQGIDIPTVFLLDGYYQRYGLQDWARIRYAGLKARADECLDCGECEEKCPYNLPIRKMLKEAAERLA